MGWFSSKLPVAQWPREIPTFVPIAASSPAADAAAEVWADRHNSPNLSAQIEQAQGRSIAAVICSALDGDARLRLNAAAAARFAGEVMAGVLGLVEKTGARRACFVVDAAAPAAWTAPLHEAARHRKATVIELPNHYPQTDPTMLVYALTGRRLKPAMLPTSQGVILLDVPAALALGGRKSSPLGVLDHRSGRAIYLDVPLGMRLGDALAAGGAATEGMILRGGDFLRDVRLSSSQTVGRGELAIHMQPAALPRAVESCIRCGWCAQVCPTGVSPAWILEAAQRHDMHLAVRGGRDACIECGLCEQICPSRLPLLEAIRQVKEM
jgi:Na+-translocating ferredoxin:NAD+ oxidoreductase subunit C